MLHASLERQKLHLRLDGLQLLCFRKMHRRAAYQLRTAAEERKQAVAAHCGAPLAFSLHLLIVSVGSAALRLMKQALTAAGRKL